MSNSNLSYELFAVAITFIMVTAIGVFLGSFLVTLLMQITLSLFVVYSIPNISRDLNKIGFVYCVSIFIGYVFHFILLGSEAKMFGEALIRIAPIIILMHYKDNKYYNNKIIRNFSIVFYIVECFLAIIEKMTLTHFVDYDSTSQAMNAIMDFEEDFRSFALMGHPLFNANIVSVFLAFILCTTNIGKRNKFFLVILGLGAIWAFNSRACMMMWLAILFYRLFLYGKSVLWIFASFAIAALLVPLLIVYVQDKGGLGRLTFDFTDGSTLTRIWAFQIFFTHPWSLVEMIMGGTKLYYPVDMLPGALDYPILENGVLMDLGYWGFILGPVKIVGEVIITYMVLSQFLRKDRFIIMTALWGVAMMNNNSHLNFLMVFYMCAFLAFGLNQKSLTQTNNS